MADANSENKKRCHVAYGIVEDHNGKDFYYGAACTRKEAEAIKRTSEGSKIVKLYDEKHVDALKEVIDRNAARWNYANQDGFYLNGLTRFNGEWYSHSVGVYDKITGRGDSLEEAIDDALSKDSLM